MLREICNTINNHICLNILIYGNNIEVSLMSEIKDNAHKADFVMPVFDQCHLDAESVSPLDSNFEGSARLRTHSIIANNLRKISVSAPIIDNGLLLAFRQTEIEN